jgi:predicted kinase
MTDADLPLLVVVTGPPASGKTTVAEALARELGLPLVAKDAIKEPLFDALGIGDREWSRALGRAAFELLFARVAAELRAGRPVIAEANFEVDTAPSAFAALPPFRLVQIHCSAPAEVLVSRFRARAGTRHAGHLDGEIVEEVRAAIASGRHDPLPLVGASFAVDSSGPLDVGALAARVRALL